MNLLETVERLVDLGKAQADPIPLKVDQAVLVPDGYTVEDLTGLAEKYLPAPRRKRASVTLHDAESFCGYYKNHKSPASVVFADTQTCEFKAILDYHGMGEQPAGWREHQAGFVLMTTPEWNTWTGSHHKGMSQMDFAEFVENNAPDFKNPPAAAMLDIAKDLKVKNDVTFNSGVKVSNGQQQLTFTEQLKATMGGGNVEVPERFTIRVVAYVGTAPVELEALLRIRVKEGKLTIWYDLLRAHKVKEEAFSNAVKQISAGCGKPVLLGKP